MRRMLRDGSAGDMEDFIFLCRGAIILVRCRRADAWNCTTAQK